MTAYLSYLAGDVLGLSGILSLFVCAVAISHYALHNISGGARTGAGSVHARTVLSLCQLPALLPADRLHPASAPPQPSRAPPPSTPSTRSATSQRA